jgi:hypothetical protein
VKISIIFSYRYNSMSLAYELLRCANIVHFLVTEGLCETNKP